MKINSREITPLLETKNTMNKARVISVITKNKLYAYDKTHLHTMKVYNT